MAEIAKRLKLTERTVNRYIRVGKLKCKHIGRTPYVSGEHLREFLAGYDPAKGEQAEKEQTS